MDTEHRAALRVPEITVLFWVVKTLTTAMGEATSDFLIHRVGVTNTPALVSVALAAGVALVLALGLQLSKGRYVAWTYWLTASMVAVFGTMAADGVHVQLGVPYVISSTFFAVVLAALFGVWWASERTLSIHSVCTTRRELFYWCVVMATFALGTALGDMTAITLHLGYLESGFLFAALIAIPAIGWWRFGLNEVVAFWFAYILTRPLGASFADWLAVPSSRGGVGLGYGAVALGLAIVIVALVAYLGISGRDAPGAERALA